ncbi:HAMP domain-containing protein [Desulfolithobacter sp.]
MLVICEECAKKYNIDETRMKGDRARFTCRQCGHLIIVEKPALRETTPPVQKPDSAARGEGVHAEKKNKKDSKQNQGADPRESSPAPEAVKSDNPGPVLANRDLGIPISAYLLLAFFVGVASVSTALAYISMQYIPQLVNEQVGLRTAAIAVAFKDSVSKPLLIRDQQQLDKEMKQISLLPGVAYAAVVNDRGLVVAGFFSDPERFSHEFAAGIRESGFPRTIIEHNRLKEGRLQQDAVVLVEGQRIHDYALALNETGGEIHVGAYGADIKKSLRNSLFSSSSLSFIGLILGSGILIFLLLTRAISKPLQELTEVVNRISLGEVDLVVTSRGPREIRELALAFERMRYSIKAAIERLRSR